MPRLQLLWGVALLLGGLRSSKGTAQLALVLSKAPFPP